MPGDFAAGEEVVEECWGVVGDAGGQDEGFEGAGWYAVSGELFDDVEESFGSVFLGLGCAGFGGDAVPGGEVLGVGGGGDGFDLGA